MCLFGWPGLEQGTSETPGLPSQAQSSPPPATPSDGSLLDNTLLLFGSASSAFHLSRNYPLIQTGGKNMGFKHGQYLHHVGDNPQDRASEGGREPRQKEIAHEDLPLSTLFVTIIQRLGVEAFADSTAPLEEV